MRHVFIALLGLLMTGIFAGQALATEGWHPDPSMGYVEICKAPNAALTDGFQFKVESDGLPPRYVSVPIGFCSDPIAVKPGTVWVTELGSLTKMEPNGVVSKTDPTTDFLSATASAIGWDGPVKLNAIGGSNGFGYWFDVPASQGDTHKVVTITYSDQLVTGVIEICKQVVGSDLTGSYQFTITGGNGFGILSPVVVTVPIGACSPAITLPAGNFKVVETGDPAENVVAISAVMPASNTNMVVGPLPGPSVDLGAATVVAKVTAGDATKQTLVTFTNDPVRLKVCKAWDPGRANSASPSATYPFTFSSSTATIAPSAANIPYGTPHDPICYMVGTGFRPGTIVNITEGVVPGTKVSAVDVNPAGMVTTPANLTNRTVSVKLGSGETMVTYTNVKALDGVLKVCKAAGAGVTTGTYSFTVGSDTVKVPVGTCVPMPHTYPFNSTQTVTEAAVAGTVVTGIAATPSNRLVSATFATRTAQVLIGENDVTELTFTNATAPAAPAGGGSSGGSSSASSPSSTTATVVSSDVVTPVVTPSLSIVSKVTAAGQSTTLQLKLAKLQKQLLTVKANEHALALKLKAVKTHALKVKYSARIAALKMQEKQLTKSIKALRK